MNEKTKTREIEMIKVVFEDERNIIDYAPPEMIDVREGCYKGGDIFITEEGDLIDLEHQSRDFDEEELAKYVELAEELYERNEVPVSIYVICPKGFEVLVPEIPIKSEATFNIQLACLSDNKAYETLYDIKERFNENGHLNEKDYEDLLDIPVRVPRKDRKNIRVECFKIIRQASEI